ncbi:hypothetical protein CI105_04635 [Candidatus Izimaplasma bacterium ZiA1]|uniref:hypothetical protein n=1 Tax=Candidatus Izimoplasma sp. ZiA1 TaxID=2024899 RepID=UPI000BAA923B|nr:hypothetical protein CI105_04635 [Candidatus Izimaplasma bacterium ZiA1]
MRNRLFRNIFIYVTVFIVLYIVIFMTSLFDNIIILVFPKYDESTWIQQNLAGAFVTGVFSGFILLLKFALLDIFEIGKETFSDNAVKIISDFSSNQEIDNAEQLLEDYEKKDLNRESFCRLHQLKAIVEENKNNTSKAIEYYKKAKKFTFKFHKRKYINAKILALHDKFEEAEALISKVTEKHNVKSYWKSQAYYLIRMANFDKLSKIIKNLEQDEQFVYLVDIALDKKAVAELKKLLLMIPDSLTETERTYYRAVLIISIADIETFLYGHPIDVAKYKESINLLEDLVSKVSYMKMKLTILDFIQVAYFRIGDFSSCLSKINIIEKHMTSKEKNSTKFLIGKANLLAQNNKIDDAIELLEDKIVLKDETNEKDYRYYFILFDLLLRKEKFDQYLDLMYKLESESVFLLVSIMRIPFIDVKHPEEIEEKLTSNRNISLYNVAVLLHQHQTGLAEDLLIDNLDSLSSDEMIVFEQFLYRNLRDFSDSFRRLLNNKISSYEGYIMLPTQIKIILWNLFYLRDYKDLFELGNSLEYNEVFEELKVEVYKNLYHFKDAKRVLDGLFNRNTDKYTSVMMYFEYNFGNFVSVKSVFEKSSGHFRTSQDIKVYAETLRNLELYDDAVSFLFNNIDHKNEYDIKYFASFVMRCGTFVTITDERKNKTVRTGMQLLEAEGTIKAVTITDVQDSEKKINMNRLVELLNPQHTHYEAVIKKSTETPVIYFPYAFMYQTRAFPKQAWYETLINNYTFETLNNLALKSSSVLYIDIFTLYTLFHADVLEKCIKTFKQVWVNGYMFSRMLEEYVSEIDSFNVTVGRMFLDKGKVTLTDITPENQNISIQNHKKLIDIIYGNCTLYGLDIVNKPDIEKFKNNYLPLIPKDWIFVIDHKQTQLLMKSLGYNIGSINDILETVRMVGNINSVEYNNAVKKLEKWNYKL